MIKASEQRVLWEFIGKKSAKSRDRENGVGPFEITSEDTEIPRHLDCPNYDQCLGFAADRRWSSFGCKGCRKTNHGRFVEEGRAL